MKKYFVLFAQGSQPGSGSSQSHSESSQSRSQSSASSTSSDESCVMTEGKIWHHKGGSKFVVVSEIFMGGTKVSPDGQVTTPNGSSAILWEGDRVDASGKVIKARSDDHRGGTGVKEDTSMSDGERPGNLGSSSSKDKGSSGSGSSSHIN